MFTVSLTHNDWSLHRKGATDQARHKEKVKDAIRENLPDIVSEESIITTDGQKIIRVPIRSLEEYRFRYDYNDQQHVGQGNGDSQVGDVLERFGQGQGPGKGPGAGDQPGIDYYEAELSMEELTEMIFEDLQLPNLEEKRLQELESDTTRFTDIRRHGPFANLDKKRTIRENLKRNAMQGRKGFGDINDDDLRFKTWETDVQRQSNAVVIAMMDVSGSMGTFEKYISRSFYFWMVKFLRSKYDNVEIVFISHHTEAREVTEDEFFTRGESGGTMASSAYALALQIIEERYKPSDWNIYPFHFSDGDNWPSDNSACHRLAADVLTRANQLGYGEIRRNIFTSSGSLMQTLSRLDNPKFVPVTIREKADVYPALRTFFGAEVSANA